MAYLDLDYGVLSSLQAKHRENVQAQNEEIIDKWANRNPVDQVKVCVMYGICSRNRVFSKCTRISIMPILASEALFHENKKYQ